MLKRLHLIILYSHLGALRRPRRVLFGLILILLVTLPLAGKLRFLLAIDDLIEPSFQTYDSLQRLKNNFHDSQNIFISIEPKNGENFSADLICTLEKWGLDLGDERTDLLTISSTFGLRQAKMNGRLLKFKNVFDVECPAPDSQHDQILKGIANIRNSPWGNLLSSKDSALTVSIAFAPDASNFRYGQFRTESVFEIKESLKIALQPWKEKLDIHWGGVAVYQAELRKAFDQTQALNGLMFIIAALIFRVFLRSWKAGLLFVGTVFGTLMITYGFMGAAAIPIDALTNATGLMLIISCLQDFIFITYGTTFLGYSWRKSMRRFLIPSFYTSLTTIIGFGSLAVSDLSIIRRFGLTAAFAAAVEWLFVFLFLPAILISMKKPFWPTPEVHGFSKKIKNLLEIQWPRWVSITLLFVIPLGIWGTRNLHVEDSPEKFFSKNHFVNEESSHFLNTRGWKAEVSLLFDKDISAILKKEILQKISKWPQVAVLESKELTEKFLLSKISDDTDKTAVQSLWEDSTFAKRLTSNTTERAILYLNTTERTDIESMIKETALLCPHKECELASGLISYIEFGERVLKTLFESLFVSLALVMLTLFFLGRHLKIKKLWIVLLSAIWGPLALLTVFYVFQVSIFFVTTICASVLVGLSGDNTIQFLFAARQKNLASSVKHLGYATFVVSFGMMVLTTVFYLSPIWPLQKLGSLMILGFALAWVGDVLILKGLLKRDT